MQPSPENEKEPSPRLAPGAKSPPSPPENGFHEAMAAGQKRRKPGGWKTMPFILGNETFERLASTGLLANFMVFLVTKYHLDQVAASNVINVYSGLNNFIPLIGAYIADTYLGRFKTIAFASFASLAGMATFTLIAWIPQLLPPSCKAQASDCKGPTGAQFGVLILALVFLSIGGAGIRPCSIPFGVDQFDSSTEKGRRGINSFFNWYYTSFTVVMLLSATLVVYIQDAVSWVWGFAIPTFLMASSIVLFFVGTRLYVHVKPEGSVFTSIAQVATAAYKKRKTKFPEGDDDVVYYDPPSEGTVVKKLPLTIKFRFLNKAALITDGEIRPDGTVANRWSLTSIQKVEEVKCLIRVVPVWAAGIISFLAPVQQGTFTFSQAMNMNRHLTHSFEIPIGSLLVISMITIAMWLPFYDRVVVPALRKVTRIEGGITLLQRIGIGSIFSIASMIVAGLVEMKRRSVALADGRQITVFWLVPQMVLMGMAEAFNILGQIEFYNKEFPENMSSVANSLFSVTMAGASYLSTVLVNVVHETTGRKGRPDWLTKDINQGRVENLYFLVAGLGVANLGYFLWVASNYRYKSRVRIDDGDRKAGFDVELVNQVEK